MFERTLQRLGQFLTRSLASLAANFASGRDLDEQGGKSLTAPLRQSAWIRAAINKVVNPLTAIELYLEENGEELDDPALAEFWNAPALNADGSRMPRAEFIETVATWLQLKGECFLVLDETWRVPFPEVGLRTPLLIARPDRMRHVLQRGELIAWDWTDAAGLKVQLAPERVIQIKLFNPYDDFRGLGPLEAALIAAGADYASAVFAKNTAEANGDQGMVVIAKGSIPTDEQREQITASLREKSNQQRRGIFRPIFLGGDISIEDPKVRAMDAAFVATRLENRKEIAAAFGVPPSFFDPQASYSIGSSSDRYILIEETCKPLGAKICGGLSRVSQLQTARPINVCLDWDDHSVMQAVRRERIDAGLKLWNTGMPMELVSDYLSLDLPEFPGWEVGYMPFSVSPIGTALPPETDPALAEPVDDTEPAEDQPSKPAEDIVQDMRRAFLARSLTRPEVEFCGCGCEPGDLDQKADKKDVARWRELMLKRRATVRAFESRFTRELMAARVEVLRRLESGAMLLAVNKASAMDFIFDLAKFKQNLTSSFNAISRTALDTAGQQLFAELGKDDPFTMPPARALSFLGERQNLIANAADDIHSQIMGTLQDGLTSGDTMKQLADRVRAEFNGISERRGRTIASTETGAAYATARQEGMRSAGVKYKRWLVSGNANTRAAHRLMNGAIVGIDEKFFVINPKNGDTDEVDGPSDPSGEPWNIINCHCVAVAEKNPPQGEAEPIA